MPENLALLPDSGADHRPWWRGRIDPTRWSEVAAERGLAIDEHTKFSDLMPLERADTVRPGDIFGPLEATPTGDIIDAVSDAILAFSGADQDCIVAVWEGNGLDEMSRLREAGCAQITGMGQQSHFVLHAPLGKVVEYWRWILPDWPVSESSVAGYSPQAIWPSTGDWFFAVPFDFNSSFFGGSAVLTERLLKDNRIESYPVSISADYRHESQKNCFLGD